MNRKNRDERIGQLELEEFQKGGYGEPREELQLIELTDEMIREERRLWEQQKQERFLLIQSILNKN